MANIVQRLTSSEGKLFMCQQDLHGAQGGACLLWGFRAKKAAHTSFCSSGCSPCLSSTPPPPLHFPILHKINMNTHPRRSRHLASVSSTHQNDTQKFPTKKCDPTAKTYVRYSYHRVPPDASLGHQLPIQRACREGWFSFVAGGERRGEVQGHGAGVAFLTWPHVCRLAVCFVTVTNSCTRRIIPNEQRP